MKCNYGGEAAPSAGDGVIGLWLVNQFGGDFSGVHHLRRGDRHHHPVPRTRGSVGLISRTKFRSCKEKGRKKKRDWASVFVVRRVGCTRTGVNCGGRRANRLLTFVRFLFLLVCVCVCVCNECVNTKVTSELTKEVM